MNQGSNFLGETFSNRDKELQSNLKEKDSLSILKDDFSSRKDTSMFTLIASQLLNWPHEAIKVFSALKSTRNFQHQSTVSRTSNSRLEANSSCCHKIRCLIRL